MNGTIPKTVIFRVIIIGESNFCEVFVELFSIFQKSIARVLQSKRRPLAALKGL